MKKLFRWFLELLFNRKNKSAQAVTSVSSAPVFKEEKIVPEKVSAPAPVPEAPLKKFKPQSSKRKHLMDYTESCYLMKNNKLHIEYNGSSAANGSNTYLDRLTNKIMKAESMYNGRIESMRCTRLGRAQEIVRGIQAYCIKRATFTDAAGQQYQII